MPRSSLASISLFEHAPTLSCDAARVPVALDEAGTAKRTATCTAATAVHVAIRRRSAALGHAHDATHGRVGSDTGLWPAQQLARGRTAEEEGGDCRGSLSTIPIYKEFTVLRTVDSALTCK